MFRSTTLKFALGPGFSGANGNMGCFKVFIPIQDRIITPQCNYEGKSLSKLQIDTELVSATNPLRLTTSNFIFQLNTCAFSP
jgi:hypothetical protein